MAVFTRIVAGPQYGNSIRVEQVRYAVDETIKLIKKLRHHLINSARSKSSVSSYIPEGYAFKGVVHLAKKSGKIPLTGLWYSEILSTALALQVETLYGKYIH